ncbi:MAG: molybdenum ABC transporter ATP-binding protein [Mangrovicoccus sp.]
MSLDVRLKLRNQDFTLDVEFHAPDGATVLFGASGSGKTSVVKAVAGLIRPEMGQVAVGDWPLLDTARGIFLPPHRRRLGYVFQEPRLFPHLTVRQNLRYGQWFAPKEANRVDLDRVIELLGLGPLLARRPAKLSGGEKQRVAIGRALLASPKLILADEPLSSLDPARKSEILPYFEMLRDEVAVPILYVTHSVAEARRLATTVVELRAGRVLRQGPAAEVLRGAQGGAEWPAVITEHSEDGLTELEANGLRLVMPRLRRAVGSRVQIRFGLRDVMLLRRAPEGISALNSFPATITHMEPQNGQLRLRLKCEAGELPADINPRVVHSLGLLPGQTCWVAIDHTALVVAPG